MVNRVSTVRKLLFLLFCHVGFVTSTPGVLGVSTNTQAWDGSTDLSEQATLELP